MGKTATATLDNAPAQIANQPPQRGFLTYEPARARVENVVQNAGEVLGRFADLPSEDAARQAFHELSAKATERGLTLTAYLEEVDPSYRYNDGLDAFERQLFIAGIRTKSDPERGIYADVVERFYMSDQPASPVLYPEYINRQIRVALLVPPILDELIAITTPIDSNSYRSIYLSDTATTGVANRRMTRVAQGAELPTVKILTSEKSIVLHKYGVSIKGTYEAFRRMRIDLFSLHLARIAMQTMLDKSSEALDTLINGDGNANPATNYNLTALDTSTVAGKLTYFAWLRWGLKLYPYQVTTVVAGEAEMLAILTLQFPNINPMMLLSMLTDGSKAVDMRLELAQGVWTTIRLVYFPLAPANVITGINKATALEMVTEIGASLTETDRIISRQYNEITISEVVGFGQLIPQAIQTLTLNA
jgi:hypothetical protein